MAHGEHRVFDLEKAIATWRQFHERQRVFLSDDLDELERHIRDHASQLQAAGMDPQRAFEQAVEHLGALDEGAEEYSKVYWGKLRRSQRVTDELAWKYAMIKNYLVIAIRNARRHFGYTCINVFGLAVGLACCLLIALFIIEELNYDTYHEHSGQIYRITKGTNASTPEYWAPALEETFPEVEYAVRLLGGFSRAVITHDEQHFKEPNGLYADASVFQVFSWPLLQGDPESVLVAPYSVVLSEQLARKHFGQEDPVGKTLNIGGMSNDPERSEYTITGVMADIPRHSHVRFEYIISYRTVEVLNDAGRWGTPLSWTNNMAKTYVLLTEQGKPDALAGQLPDFLRQHIPNERYDVTNAQLQPLTGIHLYSR